MALPFDAIGTAYPEVRARIDLDASLEYAAATNDDNPLYRSGHCTPPLFAVVPTTGAMFQLLVDVVPEENLLTLLHGEQDMFFHRPLVPDMVLRTRAAAHSTRVGSTGTRFVVKVTSTDDDGALVLEQYFTLFLRGLGGGVDLGPDTPEHVLPPDARDHPIATVTKHYDDDQTFRYRDASGDPNPIHFDESFATAAGLPGIIIHGLCTLAMASQAVVATQCGGDPSRLARIAARFKAPAFPGNDMTVTVLDLGTPGRVGYEAESGGVVVLTNGLAEIR
jgi:acyl dehydratase